MSLIETKLPGYGSAAGADTGDFPYESAAVVNNWAHLAGNLAVSLALDQVRRCLGDSAKISESSHQWSPEAAKLIIDAKEGLFSARLDLNAYWGGRAAESFSSYVDHLIDTINNTHSIMQDMATLTDELRGTVDETYSRGLDFIKECATGILDAAGSAAQSWYTLWGAVCGAILEILSTFAESVITLLQDAIDVMRRYATTGRQIGEKATDLHVPDPLPSNASEPGNWHVNPA
ncbi:hypothetical protein [Actinoalloteichus fjordicus]|uniref:Uncharacterized protein n=1 Tax=Actinoalloteichus fjordicus TaxID=1612552 RepID=A0AAC9LDM3_9PSEU|nr:hypothetical protein [Actinoalloteichus fjordicus]APU16038.1 hypothetical protein UA74_20065 [Actinoalloteichus fjordicus]